MEGPLNGTASRILWGGEPPPAPPGIATILRPKIGEELEVILLEPAAVSCWLHWLGRRSVPHLVRPGRCAGCEANAPAKQYAYIGAWQRRGQLVGILEITEHAIAHCPAILQPQSVRPLVGRHALARREKGHRASRCFLRLLDAVYEKELPAPPDVRAVLEHLWGTDRDTRALLGLTTPPPPEEESADDR